MSDTLQASPELRAIDLVRVNIDALPPDELSEHATQVLDTIAALNDFINKPGRKRADAVRNALRLVRMLGAHMARLRDLMQAHKSMQAVLHAMQSASAQHLPRTAPAFGRVRVIRPPMGADNAASGPLEIPGIKPTAWDTEARRGGEAKEAGALRQSGEAGR